MKPAIPLVEAAREVEAVLAGAGFESVIIGGLAGSGLASAANGIPVDIAFGGLPYEARVVERGSTFEFVAGVNLRTCSAEDLVVMKAFAGRERDFLDLEGVIVRQGAVLDWRLVEEELRPLLAVKGEPETWERLAAMRRAAD